MEMTYSSELRSGKITWILDDFAYVGVNDFKNTNSWNAVGDLENVFISEVLIRLFTKPFDFDGNISEYQVKMTLNPNSKGYRGSLSELHSGGEGEVYAELYQNHQGYMLIGKWFEGAEVFTWFAKC